MESATAREAALAARFPERTGLIHGRMKAEEKQAAIAAFAGGAKPLLVATTVIEVGVDVPAAEIMVVEGAEHFGLAQLHQLRGRVGRGGAPGWCVLLYAPPLSEMARRRLEILREQDDGFVIAEQDLQLRGAGDAIGTRQSGFPDYRLVEPSHHLALVRPARKMAEAALAKQGSSLPLLLRLFGHEQAVELLKAG